MKKIISKSIFLLFLLSFTACNDDNSKSTPITVEDAYIFSYISSSPDAEDKIVYSLKINAFSTNYTINSIDVNNNSSDFSLENNSGIYSYEEGPYDDYSKFIGTYTFNFTFSTTSNVTSFNKVTSDVIQPAKITSCIGNSSFNYIVVKWNTIEKANALLIQMKDSEGNIIFSNNNSYNQLYTNEYTISDSTGAWAENRFLTKGESYTIEILGFLTETDGSSYIQSESLASAIVVWE